MSKKKLNAIVLDDGRTGNLNQCLAVAEKAGMDVTTLPVSFNWKAGLPHEKLPRVPQVLSDESWRELQAQPQPDVVISAGRRLAAVARSMKKHYAEQSKQTRFIHLMHPGNYWEQFDLLAIPMHDNPPAHKTVVATQATPHRMTLDSLRDAGEAFLPQLQLFPRPYIGVVVGGDTKHGSFSVKAATHLMEQLNRMAQELGGTLLVTTSRRTSFDAVTAMREAITVPCEFYDWHDMNGEDNPYQAILALSDFLVVTGDSMSMISEAAYTGTSLYIFDKGGNISDKHRRFHEQLYYSKHARPLEDALEPFEPTPIDSANDVVAELQHIMKKA